jgi:peptidoglycan/LPS O-acetylase OafA/YrhL
VERKGYLDGLRGWAALFVVFYHTTQCWSGDATVKPLSYIPHVPQILLFFMDGRFAVYIFFALSGYVLSVGFFNSNSRSVVLELALRRYLRMTIPIFGLGLLVYLYAETMQSALLEYSKQNGVALTFSFPYHATFSQIVWYGIAEVYMLPSSGPSFSPALWTMPYELRGSFILFGILLIAGRLGFLRVAGYAAFIGYSWLHNMSEFVAISSGMAIAHLSTQEWHERFRQSPAGQLSAGLVLLCALTVAALREAEISAVLPYCAVAVLWACFTSNLLRLILTAPISIFLGRLSFPLYLMHMLAIYVGGWLVVALKDTAPFVAWFDIVVLALIFARLFLPVEMFAINSSHFFSHKVLGLFGLETRVTSKLTQPLPSPVNKACSISR